MHMHFLNKTGVGVITVRFLLAQRSRQISDYRWLYFLPIHMGQGGAHLFLRLFPSSFPHFPQELSSVSPAILKGGVVLGGRSMEMEAGGG